MCKVYGKHSLVWIYHSVFFSMTSSDHGNLYLPSLYVIPLLVFLNVPTKNIHYPNAIKWHPAKWGLEGMNLCNFTLVKSKTFSNGN